MALTIAGSNFLNQSFLADEMKIPIRALQIKLGTWLLLMIIIALVIHGLSARSIIEKQKAQIRAYEKYLPEFNIAIELEKAKAAFEESKSFYGESHPLTKKLETDITALERRRKSLEYARQDQSQIITFP